MNKFNKQLYIEKVSMFVSDVYNLIDKLVFNIVKNIKNIKYKQDISITFFNVKQLVDTYMSCRYINEVFGHGFSYDDVIELNPILICSEHYYWKYTSFEDDL